MLFSEQYFNSRSKQTGSIEVICGSMFSGKTEELIRRLRRAQFAGLPIEIFKPEMEVRYSESEIVSHDDNSIASIPVAHSSEILSLRAETKIVGIDEAQFFDQGLVDVCVHLANRGIRVIVAGLDMDYLGKPFGSIPDLLAVAEHITKVYAICMRCGAPAHYSYRTVVDQEKILLGERESYEPRCRSCFYESQDV